ncbi:alpha/beta hydrolase [Nocardiopsis sp. N85]|uniref:alpha/beta hydrolase n=1 Tax=Nocardiopsis sp. N85 TaxID=3029400 RepID=UPI00237F8068|nr:alpha/beta hydrolase [Nocardiopsis sp. N85]MDE3723837.1 alpha/beta hydrolase [Nocardiopsis sp. N85]
MNTTGTPPNRALRRGRPVRVAAVAVALLITTAATITTAAARTVPTAPERPAATTPTAIDPVAERPAETPPGVVDLEVEFTVDNVNRTRGQCSADGEEYTVRGHLTAPEAVLAADSPSVALLIHGTNTGEWIWRLDVEGRNYVDELAERGHASVTIDRLGYGSSDIPEGFASCSGAHADIAHQVVERLRAGDYEVRGDDPVAFDTVVMGGHSSGALVAESVAVSFGGVDGLFLTGWAAVGITDDTNRRFLTAYRTCLEGGEEHTDPGDPRGYVYFDPTLEDFVEGGLGPQADPAVVAEIEGLWGRNPCGVMVSEPMAILYDLDLVGEIDVPVHLVFGAHDVLRQGVEGYPGLFTSSPDVTETTLADAGHFVTIDAGAELLYDTAAEWMERHAPTS